MKWIKLLIALILLGVAGMNAAWADRGHGWGGRGHFDVMIGVPLGSWYYPPPYYYPPYYPPVVVQPQPQVYIEQQQVPAAPAESAANYWYYCAAAKGYYPYVKECPGGWQKVLPQPSGQP